MLYFITALRSSNFAARQCSNTRAGHFDQPDGAHQLGKGIDLFRRARDLECETFEGAVDNVGAENIGQTTRFPSLLLGSGGISWSRADKKRGQASF